MPFLDPYLGGEPDTPEFKAARGGPTPPRGGAGGGYGGGVGAFGGFGGYGWNTGGGVGQSPLASLMRRRQTPWGMPSTVGNRMAGGMGRTASPMVNWPGSTYTQPGGIPRPGGGWVGTGGGVQPQGGAGGASALPGDNPFGYDPYGQGGKYSYTQLGQQYLNAMMQSGLLNPLGSNAMTDMLRGRAVNDANSLRARSSTYANLAGVDPSVYSAMMLQNDNGMNQQILDSLQNAQLQSAMMNQDFLRGIVGQGFGYNYTPKG